MPKTTAKELVQMARERGPKGFTPEAFKLIKEVAEANDATEHPSMRVQWVSVAEVLQKEHGMRATSDALRKAAIIALGRRSWATK